MPLDIHRIQAICFDLDGTLRDTDDLFVWNLQNALSPLRVFAPNQDLQPIARRLVMALEDPMTWLNRLSEWGQLEILVAQVSKLFNHGNDEEKPVPNPIISGVDWMLDQLSAKFSLGIVSSRNEPSTINFLKEQSLQGFFQVIVTRQTCHMTKPSPEPVLYACEHMHVAPQNCLMIGDTTVDILSGRNAGAQTCGVLCGFGEREELEIAGADHILASTPDIVSLLGE
jgi:HAD superfamily hydrolase (TIGR01509 family)